MEMENKRKKKHDQREIIREIYSVASTQFNFYSEFLFVPEISIQSIIIFIAFLAIR